MWRWIIAFLTVIITCILVVMSDASFWIKFAAILSLAMLIGSAIAAVPVMRRIASMNMKLYPDDKVKMVPCPDCTGGAQLLGEKIPSHMFLENGIDGEGRPYFQSPQANVHGCNTCHGLCLVPQWVKPVPDRTAEEVR